MKKPNWYKWMVKDLSERGLVYFIKYDKHMEAEKMWIGFSGATLAEIEKRGTTLHALTEDKLIKYACQILKQNEIIML